HRPGEAAAARAGDVDGSAGVAQIERVDAGPTVDRVDGRGRAAEDEAVIACAAHEVLELAEGNRRLDVGVAQRARAGAGDRERGVGSRALQRIVAADAASNSDGGPGRNDKA